MNGSDASRRAARAGEGTSRRPRLGISSLGMALQGRFGWLVVLLAHVAVCTLVASWTLSWGSLHPDMTEAWAWGKEFQLGYAKHPPMFPWVAGAWFEVMPRTDWSFYLLAALNGAVGLAGVWMIAGCLLDDMQRRAAWFLVLLTPFFSIYAARYNANSALLASWPWVIYFFIRSIETRAPVHALAFGVLAAVSLLTKYYSGVLLASCLLAAVLHPERDRYFRSGAPYIAVATCALLLLPHVLWVVQAEFPTLKYVVSKTTYPVQGVLMRALAAVVSSLAGLALAGAVLVFICWGRVEQIAGRIVRALRAPDMGWLAALTFAPVILTLLFALLANVRISAAFFVPAFFMLPIFLLRSARTVVSPRALGTLAASFCTVALVFVLVLPGLGQAAVRYGWGPPAEPHRRLARMATETWHETFVARLDVVAGDETYVRALTFYSPDAPSMLSLAHPASTPWVSDKRLKASGLLIVCRAEDSICLGAAGAFDRPEIRRINVDLSMRMGRWQGPIRNLVLFLVPPGSL